MIHHTMGTADECDKEEKDKNTAMEHLQTARNLFYQATEEVNTIIGGGNGWGNDSTLLSEPRTLDISGGDASTMTQQATLFVAGGNAPNAGTTAK